MHTQRLHAAGTALPAGPRCPSGSVCPSCCVCLLLEAAGTFPAGPGNAVTCARALAQPTRACSLTTDLLPPQSTRAPGDVDSAPRGREVAQPRCVGGSTQRLSRGCRCSWNPHSATRSLSSLRVPMEEGDGVWGGAGCVSDSPIASFPCSLRREGYTVQVNVNDYLDIYCPHYNASVPEHRLEQYVLYMVNAEGYRTCNTSQGFKRWECNRPHAPHSPIKFSEKFQRYSAFSLGYEFRAGQEYYYISTPTHNHRRACLKMKVFVCCASTSHSGEKLAPTLPQFTLRPEVKIEDLENFNPEMPKLEKSISGTSPKREHLPLAVAAALFLMTLLAS
ncbi:ephrin-A3 isoform X1 [Chiroxiphia lanceolata]|uniref:ephrin-A3 isoform X1 n=1 Tax=Chiroxiphia lanceolata TaxID=296741 RepID=UPI0013CE5C09|nr:ephrin-A3 isoform X1 [Chiroxiphia lanceolata]